MKIPTAVLVTGIAAAVLAIAGGVGALLWVVFPGGSGEWIALAEPAAYAFDVPVGLAVVALAAAAAPRAPGVRRTALVAGGIALVMPLFVSLVRHLGLGPWR